jgi:flagellin-specific chaperone FliS
MLNTYFLSNIKYIPVLILILLFNAFVVSAYAQTEKSIDQKKINQYSTYFWKGINIIFDKQYLLQKNVQKLMSCKPFEYCSICTQSDAFIQTALNNSFQILESDQTLKGLHAYFNKALSKANHKTQTLKNALGDSLMEHKAANTKSTLTLLLDQLRKFLRLENRLGQAIFNKSETKKNFLEIFNDTKTYFFQEAMSCSFHTKMNYSEKIPYLKYATKSQAALEKFLTLDPP